jgi:hypothetical protein
VLLEPWFSNRTKSIVKSPKLYSADSGLLCALLNIRSEDALRQTPSGNPSSLPNCESGSAAPDAWTEVSTASDAANFNFVRKVVDSLFYSDPDVSSGVFVAVQQSSGRGQLWLLAS